MEDNSKENERSTKMLRIKFADFWPGFDEEKLIFIRELKKKYKLINSEQPDLVIASIFSNTAESYGAPSILISGEKQINRINFHKAFTCAKHELPNLSYFPYTCIFSSPEIYEKRLRNKPSKFACFIVSNGNHGDNVKLREKLFLELQARGLSIDSCGNFRRNKEEIAPSASLEYDGLFIDPHWLSQYKFNICCENNLHPGYLTEKSIQCLLAGSIPICLTHKSNMEILNPKAGIYGHNEDDIPQIIDRVLNMSDSEYEEMRAQPPFLVDMKQLAMDFQQSFMEEVDKIAANLVEKSISNYGLFKIEGNILDTIKRAYGDKSFSSFFFSSNIDHKIDKALNIIKRHNSSIYF